MIPGAEKEAQLKSLVDAVLTAACKPDVQNATNALFRHLCENPRPTVPGSGKVKLAVVVDSGNECIGEIVYSMLTDEWRANVTVASYKRLTDVIRMVRDALPAVLVLHANLLLTAPEGGLAGCVAVSPTTRYIIMTAWPEEGIKNLHKFYEPLHIMMQTLEMPFDRTQLIPILESAGGLST